jgi:hypothetical protein
MTTTHIALTVAGGSLVIVGGLLAGSAEVSRYIRRVRDRLGRVRETVATSVRSVVRRLLGRPGGPVIIQPKPGGGLILGSDGARTPILVPADATPERQLEVLRAVAERVQERLDDVEDGLVDATTQLRDEARAQRGELLRAIDDRITRSELRYEPHRFVGVVFVTIGSFLLVFANLVQ